MKVLGSVHGVIADVRGEGSADVPACLGVLCALLTAGERRLKPLETLNLTPLLI